MWRGLDDAEELYGALIGVLVWGVNKKARLERSRSFCLGITVGKFGALVVFQVSSVIGNNGKLSIRSYVALKRTIRVKVACRLMATYFLLLVQEKVRKENDTLPWCLTLRTIL